MSWREVVCFWCIYHDLDLGLRLMFYCWLKVLLNFLS